MEQIILGLRNKLILGYRSRDTFSGQFCDGYQKIAYESGGLLNSAEGQISKILAGYELIYESLLNNFQSQTIRS